MRHNFAEPQYQQKYQKRREISSFFRFSPKHAVMKETETNDATPEQLIQMLDIQMAVQRSQREKSGRKRAIVLVSGILFIVFAAGAALLVLDQMLMDMKSGDRMPVSGQARSNGK